MKKSKLELNRKLILGKEIIAGLGTANNHILAAPDKSQNCASIFMCEASGIYCPDVPEIQQAAG